MRTRSQNVSPGGFVSLPPPSRKRRTQRRASPSSESDNKKSSSKKGRKARNGSAAGEGAAPPVAQLAQGGDVPPEESKNPNEHPQSISWLFPMSRREPMRQEGPSGALPGCGRSACLSWTRNWQTMVPSFLRRFFHAAAIA